MNGRELEPAAVDRDGEFADAVARGDIDQDHVYAGLVLELFQPDDSGGYGRRGRVGRVGVRDRRPQRSSRGTVTGSAGDRAARRACWGHRPRDLLTSTEPP